MLSLRTTAIFYREDQVKADSQEEAIQFEVKQSLSS